MARRSDLANALERARAELGLSRPAAAERLGVGRSTLHNWETGVSVPQAHMLPLLAERLNMDEAELRTMRDRAERTRRRRVNNRHVPPAAAIAVVGAAAVTLGLLSMPCIYCHPGTHLAPVTEAVQDLG